MINLQLNEYQARNLHWLLRLAFANPDVKVGDEYVLLHNGDWNGETLWALEQRMHEFEGAGGEMAEPNQPYPGKPGTTWKENTVYMKCADDQPFYPDDQGMSGARSR